MAEERAERRRGKMELVDLEEPPILPCGTVWPRPLIGKKRRRIRDESEGLR